MYKLIQSGQQLSLVKTAVEYCKDDVESLFQVWEKYRQIWLEQVEFEPSPGLLPEKVVEERKKWGKVDPCAYNTAASISLHHAMMYIPPNTLNATLKVDDRHSAISIEWIKMMERTLSRERGYEVRCVNAHDDYCEERIEVIGPKGKTVSLPVDGYHKDPTDEHQPLVLEFLGCAYHGCPKCYRGDAQKSVSKVNPKKRICDLLEDWQRKRKLLTDQGYEVMFIWEHDWMEMRKHIDLGQDTREIFVSRRKCHPQDALYGGMVGGTYSSIECDSDYFIAKMDVCSEYPSVLYYCEMPIGQPQSVTWHEEAIKDIKSGRLFGVAKVKVLPPKDLYDPVIPIKVQVDGADRRIETLCRSCAESQNQGACHHSNKDRAFEGTYPTILLQYACEIGYEILEFYHGWYYPERSKTLFRDFVRFWSRKKREAKRTGNKGLQAVAKQMLNSPWGKLCQAVLRRQMKRVKDDHHSHELINLRNHDNLKIHLYTHSDMNKDQTANQMTHTQYVRHTQKQDYSWAEERGLGNAPDHLFISYDMQPYDLNMWSMLGVSHVLGAFVTSWARIHLHKFRMYYYLQALTKVREVHPDVSAAKQRELAQVVVYGDTDSNLLRVGPTLPKLQRPYVGNETAREANQELYMNRLKPDLPPPFGDCLGEWDYDHGKLLKAPHIDWLKLAPCSNQNCGELIPADSGICKYCHTGEPEHAMCRECGKSFFAGMKIPDVCGCGSSEVYSRLVLTESKVMCGGKKFYCECFGIKGLVPKGLCNSCGGELSGALVRKSGERAARDANKAMEDGVMPQDPKELEPRCPYCKGHHQLSCDFDSSIVEYTKLRNKGLVQTREASNTLTAENVQALIEGDIEAFAVPQPERIERVRFGSMTTKQFKPKKVRTTIQQNRVVLKPSSFEGVTRCRRTLPFGHQDIPQFL